MKTHRKFRSHTHMHQQLVAKVLTPPTPHPCRDILLPDKLEFKMILSLVKSAGPTQKIQVSEDEWGKHLFNIILKYIWNKKKKCVCICFHHLFQQLQHQVTSPWTWSDQTLEISSILFHQTTTVQFEDLSWITIWTSLEHLGVCS